MCTVSFIPVKNGFYFTTNRDEKESRKPAIKPARHIFNNHELFYPKDSDACGTWVAMKNNTDAAILLNGAFKNHSPDYPYRQSRGIILLELFSTDNPSVTFKKIYLDKIEPFTLILFENDRLYEIRWDGSKKHFKELDLKPQTWCSVTLYNEASIKIKEDLFNVFIKSNPAPSLNDILQFHKKADFAKFQIEQSGNNNILYSTVSITNIHINNQRAQMYYSDLKNNVSSEIQIELKKSFLQLNETNF